MSAGDKGLRFSTSKEGIRARRNAARRNIPLSADRLSSAAGSASPQPGKALRAEVEALAEQYERWGRNYRATPRLDAFRVAAADLRNLLAPTSPGGLAIDPARVGEVLYDVRTALGLSLSQVAAETGLPKSVIHKAERGGDIRVSTASRIVRWLNTKEN